jgi:chemotaxis signal transduction protein
VTAARKKESAELVYFSLGKKPYAVPAELIQEILPLIEPTPVPAWPPDALGLINVRGNLLPLVDIAPQLSRGQTVVHAQTLIMIVQIFGRQWGILVDTVTSVGSAIVTYDFEEPGGGTSIGGMLIQPDGSLVMVLNLEGTLKPFSQVGTELVRNALEG